MKKQKKYNQIKAILSIAKASLKASLRNPSSVVFALIFPLIFILVFGFIGNGGGQIELGVTPNSNKDNPVWQIIEKSDSITILDNDQKELESELSKGRISGIIDIQQQDNQFKITLQTSESNPQGGQLVTSLIEGIANSIELQTIRQTSNNKSMFDIQKQVVTGREYKSIDFILPGQLGFSVLNTGIFATAFVFISLKETLVIKRFFATPIKRSNIVIGEALSRLTFSLLQASIIILVGKFAFGFTLVHGIITFLSMLVLTTLGLTIFLGIGFVVSSVAKDENAVPPIANLFTLPQFLLAGTFFPIEAFPDWLQPISRMLPLTYLNDALRKVAFEGLSLLDVGKEIGVLLIWGVIVYAIAIKLFKWE